ncbi:MAG: hypothetical protein HDR80_00385 [Bacteroides sp.]|nr:hypothetical protein [Bacteroides sp.]
MDDFDPTINGNATTSEAATREIEMLKAQWQDLNQRLKRLEGSMEEDGRRIVTDNIKSAKETLVSKYRKFFIIGIVMSVLTPLVFMNMLPELGVEGWQKIVCMGLFWLYFLVAALEDSYLMACSRNINLLTWTVERVSREAHRLRHIHHLCMVSMIILAIMTLGFFIYNIHLDTPVLIGVICGGTAGLAIGLKEYRQIMNAYKELINDPEDTDRK